VFVKISKPLGMSPKSYKKLRYRPSYYANSVEENRQRE
jgi:hypothetical protein